MKKWKPKGRMTHRCRMGVKTFRLYVQVFRFLIGSSIVRLHLWRNSRSPPFELCPHQEKSAYLVLGCSFFSEMTWESSKWSEKIFQSHEPNSDHAPWPHFRVTQYSHLQFTAQSENAWNLRSLFEAKLTDCKQTEARSFKIYKKCKTTMLRTGTGDQRSARGGGRFSTMLKNQSF